jgi:uncharacterized protein (DUF2164 family)
MPPEGVSLPRDDREFALERIKAHLREESGDEPGDLAAILFFDFVAEEMGPLFYNAGIAAAQKALLHALDELDADLEATKRPLPRRDRQHEETDAR